MPAAGHEVPQPVREGGRDDVQGVVGLRGARRVAGWEVTGEYSSGRRLNWLFQNTARAFDDFDSVDVNLSSFVLTVSPSLRPRG